MLRREKHYQHRLVIFVTVILGCWFCWLFYYGKFEASPHIYRVAAEIPPGVKSPDAAHHHALHATEQDGKTPSLTPTTIAFLVPARSIENETVEEVSLLKILVPSILATVSESDWARYTYVIYLGFDEEDLLYDNDQSLSRLKSLMKKIAPKLHIRPFCFKNTRGRPVIVWNRLAKIAFDDGCHYFYQINDDVTLMTPDWTNLFVNLLRNNKRFPDLGVVGPLDVGRPKPGLLTQAFFSRIHMHIFDAVYPSLFDNWFSDDWMSQVYMPNDVFHTDKELKNSNPKGTRYNIVHGDAVHVLALVKNGKRSIDEFAETHFPGKTVFDDPLPNVQGLRDERRVKTMN